MQSVEKTGTVGRADGGAGEGMALNKKGGWYRKYSVRKGTEEEAKRVWGEWTKESTDSMEVWKYRNRGRMDCNVRKCG